MNQDAHNSPLSQLFKLTLGTQRSDTLPGGQLFMEEGGSILRLVKMGRQGLMNTFEVSEAEASILLDKANSVLVHLARQYRCHRLTRHTPRNPLHETGIRSSADGPDYHRLFKLAWGNTTPVGSLDANDSPAAYFVELYQKALQLEEREASGGQKILLEERRPDLATRVINPEMAYRISPTVVLVNEVLDRIIENHAAATGLENDVVDDRLLNTRYPMTTLPFEWYQEQWDYVLKQNDLSLGDVVRIADPDSPYFKNPGAHGNRSDIAMRQASGLGPAMQAILLEDRFTFNAVSQSAESNPRIDPRTGRIDADPETTNEQFFQKNFGATYEELQDVVKFCTHTSIDADSLASLLSIERYAPTVSPNLTKSKLAAPTPAMFGSVFINADGNQPAIGITESGTDEIERTLANATKRRFDLINRMLRLARRIDLPYDECDRLVIAAIRAEQRAPVGDEPEELSVTHSYKISGNTLRAIGLFQEFRRHYNCTAEDFSALIDEMSAFGRGEKKSQFDRVFNAQSLFEIPLQLDGGAFAIHPQTEIDRRTVDQICSGLGINLETWRYLARVVAECYGLRSELTRSLPILSSLYRLVRLASFCGITSIELAALLETMSPSGSDWLRELLGAPRISNYRTIPKADVLNVLHAVHSCIQWCRDNDLEVIWLVQHVAPVVVPVVASEAELALLQELRKRLEPTRLREEALLGAGVPPLAVGSDWLTLLDQLVDEKGLVLSGHADDEEAYENFAKGEIEGAVELAKIDVTQVERVKATILAILLQTRAAQSAVVQESLSVYLNIAQDLTLVVLRWVESGGAYLLLNETMRVLGAGTMAQPTIELGDDILKVLAHLVRRTAVVKKLSLSSAMLTTLTTQEHWRWFGLRQIEELTLNSFYLLTIYGRAVVHTEEPAEKLLAYLKLVNDLPAQLTPEDLRMIRDAAANSLAQALKWGIKEVLECANYLAPEKPLIRELSQLDFVIRARGFAVKTGLDANAILTLGALSPESDVVSCRQAAEHALQCLSESAIQSKALEFGEVGQSVAGSMTVSDQQLICNAPGEYSRVEVTLRDFQNEPLSNITVTWECARSGLQDLESITDHEGRASVRFKAGSWMGLATVIARYGLGQRVYAEPILIDCHEESIKYLNSSTSRPPFDDKLAGDLEYLELQVRLVDSFDNFAADRPIRWGCTAGHLDPVVSYTNKDGIARTRLRSRSAENNIEVTAQYADKDVLTIKGMKFVDRPRISVLEAVSPAVAGLPLLLRCKVVGLDGRPLAKVPVNWLQGEAALPSSETNENGEARCEVATIAEGPVVFKATVAGGSMTLDLDVAAGAVIHGRAADYLLPVAGSDRPSLLWVEVRETANNDARPIARYPISWQVYGPEGDLPGVPVITDAKGRSTFPFLADKSGEYTVTATGVSGSKTFNLEVVEPLKWSIKLIDITGTPVEETIEPNGALTFFRGHKYRLELTPVTNLDLTGARAALGWSGAFSAKAMGMTFAPLTGAYTEVVGDTMSWTIDCANLRSGEFELTWLCNRVDQSLVLKGYLDSEAPALQHPLPDATVEQQMVVGGTGAPAGTIQVFIGKHLPYRAQTRVDAQGRWSVQLPQAQAAGACVLSIKQLAVDGAVCWAPDVSVTVDVSLFAPPQIQLPPMGAPVGPKPLISGFGRPGTRIEVQKAGLGTVYGTSTVQPDGWWVVEAEEIVTPDTYRLTARLFDGDKPSGYGSDNYPIEVVADPTLHPKTPEK
ncbi:virulence plasmid 28 protein [Pseudomonas laurylsulfatiphila]|uniref:Virulence plasmid 28 protein n=1 Tax=Pseudomonas laurylsulfatiphila TaxID=2011015 RepID=A0A2S6FMQ1_9PSED|nr:Tc toxin subunit A [Pseudomonas laurylsulfatiphila]PPK38695.1 virulence plasmid 28 protein [Pseudomonas laurylsulfatiphila]